MTSTQNALRDQADGLGYCPVCDHEYTEAQISHEGRDYDFSGDTDFCPNCRTSEERILYWCQSLPLHAPFECEKFHHD